MIPVDRRYVLGFLFDKTFRVALVRKKTGPGGQKGKLNGFGGKIEGDETPLVAMQREFREESGFARTRPKWHALYTIGDEWGGFEVHCFCALVPGFKPFTGREAVEVYPIEAIPGPTVSRARELVLEGAATLRKLLDRGMV